MIVGIGVDVVDVARLAARLEAAPGLGRRLLTDAEAAACGGRARAVAARLAAKEGAGDSFIVAPDDRTACILLFFKCSSIHNNNYNSYMKNVS